MSVKIFTCVEKNSAFKVVIHERLVLQIPHVIYQSVHASGSWEDF